MKPRKFISLLLLAVYLLATGGAAYASLSCRCVSLRMHVVQSCTCGHCCHEDHALDAPAAKADLKAPCCGDHHSTEIELYTGSSFDNDRVMRCAVLLLPAALVAEQASVPAVAAVVSDKAAERRAPFLRCGHVRTAGLRAPPVLA